MVTVGSPFSLGHLRSGLLSNWRHSGTAGVKLW
jgi:hypothetical protein